MSADRRTFVIVGAGLTAGAATSALRDHGFDGRLVLIGAESHPPYERPPLSKAYLRGESTFDDAILHPVDWYAEHDVEAMFGVRVARVDPQAGDVHLADGTRIPFDRALIATGARNRAFDVPGRELDGVFQLRTGEDADRIRARASAGATAVVVGAGFIGCEVAASLRARGVEVHVLDRGGVALQRVVGLEVGTVIERVHADHGVSFRHGVTAERFEGSATDGVGRVMTTGGERIDCDLVVVGVGVEPATDVVAGTSVQVDNGIVTDAYLRTTAPNVFAAGDLANHDHPVFGRRLRVEHWDNALKSGVAAARNMLDEEVPYADPHWFWSDQYDVEIQYAGHAVSWDRCVFRGSLQDRNFLAFYVDDGIVRGVLGMNRGREVRRSMALVRAAKPIDPAALEDEDVDVRDLAARVGAGR